MNDYILNEVPHINTDFQCIDHIDSYKPIFKMGMENDYKTPREAKITNYTNKSDKKDYKLN